MATPEVSFRVCKSKTFSLFLSLSSAFPSNFRLLFFSFLLFLLLLLFHFRRLVLKEDQLACSQTEQLY